MLVGKGQLEMSDEELGQRQENRNRASSWHAWNETLVGGASKCTYALVSVGKIPSDKKVSWSSPHTPIFLPVSILSQRNSQEKEYQILSFKVYVGLFSLMVFSS